MTIAIHRFIAAAALGVAIGAGSAHGASEEADTPSSPAAEAQTPQHAERQEPGKRARQKKPTRFESCKRDARGVSGPERARFMTECLHERL